jgi:hypothetical protein
MNAIIYRNGKVNRESVRTAGCGEERITLRKN